MPQRLRYGASHPGGDHVHMHPTRARQGPHQPRMLTLRPCARPILVHVYFTSKCQPTPHPRPAALNTMSGLLRGRGMMAPSVPSAAASSSLGRYGHPAAPHARLLSAHIRGH